MKILRPCLAAALAVAAWLVGSAFVVLPRTEYSLTVIADGSRYVFAYPEIDFGPDGLYLKGAAEAARRIAADLRVRPVDAAVRFVPSSPQPFTITDGRDGKEIDTAALEAEMRAAIARGDATLAVNSAVAKPDVTAQNLRECTFVRARFWTDYESSSEERKHNISLAAAALSGAVVEPGGEFSFNLQVGKRTRERGYEEAKVIYEGKYTQGVGGGVCQVSTTLYNAALLAGLNVVERHPHSLAVPYVEPSFDAMVSDGNADLRFINATGGRVYLAAAADGKRLTITVYGRTPAFTVKRVSKTLKTSDPGYRTVYDETVDEDTVTLPSKPSLVSTATVEFYVDGKLINTLPLSRDSYGGVMGIITKKPPESHK